LINDILNIIGHGSPTIFKGVILLIFEKALDEPKYSSMYAQLCKRLNENAPNLEPPECKITTFKRLLLSKCKDEFENRAAVSAAYEKRVGDLTIDEEEARFLAKRKMLGNIKFIGELGKLEMLHDSILHRCCEQLLVGRRKQSIVDQTEDIECLAHLMKTCGRLLDSAKAKMLMDQYFDRIKALIANPDMPTRIRFLLQDVCEMRNNHWKPRKLATPDGPRTIQQVREDAARDGCIYLPQQDLSPAKQETGANNKIEEVIFSKSRPKGMEDIFGAPGDFGMNLGMGPGVIPEATLGLALDILPPMVIITTEMRTGDTEAGTAGRHLRRSSRRITGATTTMTETGTTRITTRSETVSSPSLLSVLTSETGSQQTGTRRILPTEDAAEEEEVLTWTEGHPRNLKIGRKTETDSQTTIKDQPRIFLPDSTE